jgi:hypothetical protein
MTPPARRVLDLYVPRPDGTGLGALTHFEGGHHNALPGSRSPTSGGSPEGPREGRLPARRATALRDGIASGSATALPFRPDGCRLLRTSFSRSRASSEASRRWEPVERPANGRMRKRADPAAASRAVAETAAWDAHAVITCHVRYEIDPSRIEAFELRGRPWSGAAVRTEFRRVAAEAGVRRRFAPHQLRHAHALELAREGVPLNIIQRQLGHSNVGTTSICLQDRPGGDHRRGARTRAPMMSASAGPRL